jgi:uncharacterized protein YbjT (DUF2867 family)
MSIAVTGATGHLGRLAIDNLLRAGVAAADVVAVVRNPAKACAPTSAPRSKRRASRAINHRSVPRSCSRGFFATPQLRPRN